MEGWEEDVRFQQLMTKCPNIIDHDFVAPSKHEENYFSSTTPKKEKKLIW